MKNGITLIEFLCYGLALGVLGAGLSTVMF